MRTLQWAAAGAVLMAVTLGGCAPAVPTSHPSSLVYADVSIGGVQGDDLLSSQNLDDWARESDYVAVVQVTAEQELPQVESETAKNSRLVLRSVTVEVRTIVWAHPNTREKAPTSFDLTAMGWMKASNNPAQRTRVGMASQPYLLPGHTYLMALRDFEYGCPGRIDPGDAPLRKEWGSLGSHAVVPFNSDLGSGEFEGRAVTRAGERDQTGTFRKQMIGKTTEWVAEQLSAAVANDPRLTHTAGPLPECSRR